MSSSLIPKITAQLETLREPQLALVDHLVGLLQIPVQIFKGDGPNLISDEWASHFGDSLVAHHANSLDEFRKERFEHAYLRACRLCGIAASKPLSNTNPGYDLIIGGQRLALKTQADKKIKTSIVEISKFMELGSYDWQLRVGGS
jgi:hypothetical protein